MNLDLKQRKPKGVFDEREARVLWDTGHTDKQIGEFMGVAVITVRLWRNQNGLPINRADGTRAIQKPKKKQRVLSPLEQDAKAAREAGMTYGQYKAKQREELWAKRKQTHVDIQLQKLMSNERKTRR